MSIRSIAKKFSRRLSQLAGVGVSSEAARKIAKIKPEEDNGYGAKYRNCSEQMQNLIEVAHQLADKYGHETEAQIIIDNIHAIRGRTLRGSVPDKSLMSDFANLLDDNGISFAIIGSVALMVHGQIRDTNDIDALVSAFPPSERLSDPRYMEKFGFYKAKSSTGTVLTVDWRRNGQVEMLVANTDLFNWALSTAQEEMVLGNFVPVISAAALIALKIRAMTENPKRVHKDDPDIRSIWVKSKPDLTEARSYLTPGENIALSKIIGEE